ncbi:hypothetical protein PCANC_24268 [Puccinia coronata f. sp. avenae]|uniref:Uncharacterized protein n=1 Tax=Puccinia coronata f. sp. avenae TaxID=200324 RepID=A0A2N5S2U1_9BASI|nr:hypothetical protein PCANC_24268 [Puccinia coronata f. sp. avenae]PLW45500.1 hypothetical protein PCASD_05940 [Puccinia coronata f. sp. avenae]
MATTPSVNVLAKLDRDAVNSTGLMHGAYPTAGTTEGILTLRLAVCKVVPMLAGFSSARGVTASRATLAVGTEIVITLHYFLEALGGRTGHNCYNRLEQ